LPAIYLGSNGLIVIPAMVSPNPMTPIRMPIVGIAIGAPVVARRVIAGTVVVRGTVKHRYWDRDRESDKPPRLRRLRSEHPKGEHHPQDQKPLFHISSIEIETFDAVSDVNI
jgi:hypothetical protein